MRLLGLEGLDAREETGIGALLVKNPVIPRMKRGMTDVFERVKARLSRDGAILTSHGETIAGLSRSLKDGFAAAERPPGGRSLTDLDSPARRGLQEM